MQAVVASVLSSCQTVLVAPGLQEAWGTIDHGTSRVGFASREEFVAPLIVSVLVAVCLLGLAWIRAHSRVQEKRLDLIRELSAKGQLTPRTTERYLFPPSRLKAAVLVAAWFGLIGGAAMIITAIANGWRYDFEEIGGVGVAVFVMSLATLTAPMALAEVRRHTAG